MKISKTQLPNPLTEGGEGILYEIPKGVIKWFKPTVNISKKIEKIQRLMQKKMPKEVAIPLDVVYDERGNAVGYLMEKRQGVEMKQLGNKKFVKTQHIQTKQILSMLQKIKETLQYLHTQGIVIGDLNDRNLLFDEQFHIHWIDVDSWSVDELLCDVCMENFQDPMLKNGQFTPETDAYAFSILAFKSLTFIHPFGGVMTPDLPLLERMKRKMSVIDRPNVIVPKLSRGWAHLSPELIQNMKSIFEQEQRTLLGSSLNDNLDHLTYCSNHQDYYYSRFNHCPVCEPKAKIRTVPTAVASASSLPWHTVCAPIDALVILSPWSYMNQKGEVVHISSGETQTPKPREKILYTQTGTPWIRMGDDQFSIYTKQNVFHFEKKRRSKVIVRQNNVYFISKNHVLTEIKMEERGNQITPLRKTATRSFYNIHDSHHYLIYHAYEKKTLVEVDGYMHEFPEQFIQSMAACYDANQKEWLLIIENEQGEFHSWVFQKNQLMWNDEQLRYQVPLSTLCFSNRTLFMAKEGMLRGYSYSKNQYKDFECPGIEEGAQVLRHEQGFFILNEKSIVHFG